MKRTLIIWGAGRIGRGFVADIFDDSAFQTVFVDIDKTLVDELNARGEYTIARATRDGISERVLRNGFTAVHTDDAEALQKLFLQENLLLDIAVHAPKLPEVADMLAPLFAYRAEHAKDKPMDVMMNVNMSRPDERFWALMRERLTGNALEYLNESVGVTGIFAMCISPVAPDWLREKDPLALWNNGYPEQAIGRTLLKCPPPVLPRLRLTEDVEREETRKLYTLNMAHALLCYLGLPLGLKTAREAATDERLRPVLVSALEEASAGLTGEYGFPEEEMRAWRETILSLLENPYIEDGLQRLGADSRRKLGPYDRLVGPARLCMKHGKAPESLAKAIYAGFRYENDDDGTRDVRTFVRQNGISAAAEKYCGLLPDSELYHLIVNGSATDSISPKNS